MDIILPPRVIPESFTYLMKGAFNDLADRFSLLTIGNHE